MFVRKMRCFVRKEKGEKKIEIYMTFSMMRIRRKNLEKQDCFLNIRFFNYICMSFIGFHDLMNET